MHVLENAGLLVLLPKLQEYPFHLDYAFQVNIRFCYRIDKNLKYRNKSKNRHTSFQQFQPCLKVNLFD